MGPREFNSRETTNGHADGVSRSIDPNLNLKTLSACFFFRGLTVIHPPEKESSELKNSQLLALKPAGQSFPVSHFVVQLIASDSDSNSCFSIDDDEIVFIETKLSQIKLTPNW